MLVSLILLVAVLLVFAFLGSRWFRSNPKYAHFARWYYLGLGVVFIIGVFVMRGKFG